jgi:uncharacterized membrane protein
MRVNGPVMSRLDLAGAWLPFAGLFWQAIILALIVIALTALVN